MQVRWITFHSGYDFGYLLKVLTCQPLPQTEADFFELLKVGVPGLRALACELLAAQPSALPRLTLLTCARLHRNA